MYQMEGRPRPRRLRYALAATVTLLLVATACAGNPGNSNTGASKTLRINTETEIVSIDPHINSASSYDLAMRHIFDTLVRRDNNGVTQPLLATEWEVVDELTWRFVLRQDARFHDGEGVRADDVEATFERMVEIGDAFYMGYFRDVESMTALDDYTVEIKTTAPKTDLLVSLEAFQVLPAHLLDDDFGEHPVGSGPFKFDEWRPGEMLRIVRNDDYWGGAPKLDAVEFLEIREASTIVTALLSGELDVVFGLDADSVETVESSGVASVVTGPSWQQFYMIPNHSLEKFQDVRVRRALFHAIDQQEIQEAYFGDLASVMNAPVSSTIAEYVPQTPYEYDPDLARQLLADAGYPNGLEVELAYVQDETSFIIETANEIAKYWEAVGVRTRLVGEDQGTFFDRRLPDGDFEIQLVNNRGGLGTTASTLGRLWHSNEVRFGHSDPEADRLIELARGEFDPDKQMERWQDEQRYVWEQAKAWWLFNIKAIYGVSNRVENFTPTPDFVAGFRFTELDLT